MIIRDQEFSSDMNSRAVQRIDDVAMLRRMQFAEDAGPLAHPVRPDNYMEINNFYTVTVYEKGAEVIRMMEVILGREGFRKGMDLYFERHDGQAVTCMDFVDCMEDANNIELKQFRLWYEQAGTPEIHVDGHYDDESNKYFLKMRQHIPATPGQSDKKPMHIPIKAALVGQDGQDLAETVVHLLDEEQEYVFLNVNERPYLSALRNFSAPVKLNTNQTHEDLKFLMVHDSDGFNRWEAGQTLYLRIMNEMIDDVEQCGYVVKRPEFVDIRTQVLEKALEKDGDKMLSSRALALPDVPIIGQGRKIIDTDSIWAVRECVLRETSKRHPDLVQKLYYDNHEESGEYSITPESIARRSLKNTALRMMCYGEGLPSGELAAKQYENATNMTDRLAALSVMIGFNHEGWEDCFSEFHLRFEDYPLVIDKWFALQASTVRDDTISRVRKLSHHPDFNIKNPNRARSLYAAFAMNNPVCFHDRSGEGYELLGEAVIELNELNPGIAARFLTPLREWRRYTQDRQEKMKAVLEKIASQKNVSRNVYEVVTKSLI